MLMLLHFLRKETSHDYPRRAIIDTKSRESTCRRLSERLAQRKLESPSTCAEWTVADVVAHLTSINRNYSKWIIDSISVDFIKPESLPKRTNARVDATRGAQTAIALRQELGDQLLPEYIRANRAMEQALDQVGPDGWDKLCYRTTGAEPIRNIVDTFIVDVGVHRWDVIYPFDKGVRLSEEGLPVMVERYSQRPRWWEIELPEDHPELPVRFRLQTTDVDAPGTDFVIESDSEKYMEVSDNKPPNVSFKCDAETFVLLTYGRISPSSAKNSGRLFHEGDTEWANIFISSYVGG